MDGRGITLQIAPCERKRVTFIAGWKYDSIIDINVCRILRRRKSCFVLERKSSWARLADVGGKKSRICNSQAEKVCEVALEKSHNLKNDERGNII